MNKKQNIVLIVGLVCLIFIYYSFYKIIYDAHKIIIDSADEYVEYELPSEDGRYILQTQKVITDGVRCADFIISNSAGKVVYECQDSYRLCDLKDIKWNKLDVVVESSDLGTIIYEYDSEKEMWNKNTNDLEIYT